MKTDDRHNSTDTRHLDRGDLDRDPTLVRDSAAQTRRRREKRSRRRRVLVLVTLGLLAMMILAAPSVLSHSSIGPSMVTQTLGEYQLDGEVDKIRIGWITPLQITGLEIRGRQPSDSIEASSGSRLAPSRIAVAQIDANLTLLDLIRDSSMTRLGQISLRGVDVACAVDQGTTSLERDLAPLWEGPSTDGPATTGVFQLQDVSVAVTDARTGATWNVTQASGEVTLAANSLLSTFAAALTEPRGNDGSINGSFEMFTGSTVTEATSDAWKVDATLDSLPLSIVSLVRRRYPEYIGTIPESVTGDASGKVTLSTLPTGAIEASLAGLSIRELTAQDDVMFGEGGQRTWHNALASIEGDLLLTDTRIIGRGVRATTDFASATMDGEASTTFSLAGPNDNPLRWLEAINGTATAEVDLARLIESMPGILPLRDDARLLAGRAIASVETQGNTANGNANFGAPISAIRRSKLILRSDAIRGTARGTAVVIDPIELTATVASDGETVRAETFQWQSAFGSAIGQGDARSGNADIEIDFGRLTAMLRPFIDMAPPESSGSGSGSGTSSGTIASQLAGSIRGNIRWDATPDDVWRLSGQGDATNLVIGLPGGQSIKRQAMRSKIEAVGRWGGQSLSELSDARVTIATDGLDIQATLAASVANPDLARPMPITIQGTGRLETLAELASPWLPAQWKGSTGGFRFGADAAVSTNENRITVANLELTTPRIAYDTMMLAQQNVNITFRGDAAFPASTIDAQELTVESESLRATIIGKYAADALDMNIQWSGQLDRLQSGIQMQMASSGASATPVGFREPSRVSGSSLNAASDESWLVRGKCDGEVNLKSDGDWILVTTDCTGVDLAILQPVSASAMQTVGPMPTRNGNRPASTPAPQTVWAEPNLKVGGKVRYHTGDGTLLADAVQVAGDWFAATLTGQVIWNEQLGDVRLTGPARLKMDEVARRLSPLAGIQIQADGVHETPLDIRVGRNAGGEMSMNIAGKLGWESGEVAGVSFGQASIPFVLSETSVVIQPSRVPVFPATVSADANSNSNSDPSQTANSGANGGHLNLAGRVNYSPGPMWMQIEPGLVADSIQLTPEITERWLKYLAPLAANAARIDGTISAELDEAIVVFDDPSQTRVIGRMNLGGVNMNAGPLANQLISGFDQLRMLAGSSSGPSENRTLVTMPPQTVDFSVASGVIAHERMFFEIDRAQIITSGRVAMDGRLNMIAQVPLDARWLGRDLQGLAGQPVTLPIDGTLSRPSLDSSGVRQVVSQLGTQAIQSQAETYLQKQLGKQMEKIGLDKLFGR